MAKFYEQLVINKPRLSGELIREAMQIWPLEYGINPGPLESLKALLDIPGMLRAADLTSRL